MEELANVARGRSVGRVLGLDHKTTPVEVLKVALTRRLLEGISEEHLHFRNLLQVVGYLEALHIYGNSARGKRDPHDVLTLHNACKLVVFVEV